MDLSEARRANEAQRLDLDDLDPDPVAQFTRWLEETRQAGLHLPEAMALATVDTEGRPTVRHVLLRGLDDRGFVFFTNRDSDKGRQLAGNPAAAVVFPWHALSRQVRVDGTVESTSPEEDDAYFGSRPRDRQVGAWASPQSRVITSREDLDQRVAETEARFAGAEVPRPPNWGGYRLVPRLMEVWQGHDDRLHDRFRYRRTGGGSWVIERLAP